MGGQEGQTKWSSARGLSRGERCESKLLLLVVHERECTPSAQGGDTRRLQCLKHALQETWMGVRETSSQVTNRTSPPQYTHVGVFACR